MSGVNKAILIGHLGADPEVRRTAEGKPVATLRVATGESWRDKATGERKERTEWHRVVIFNEGLAGVVEQYAKKGAKVYVEGAIHTRKWVGQDGQDKYTTEIVLSGFQCALQLLDRAERPAPDESSYGNTRTSRPATPPEGAGKRGANRGDVDDEIPF